jgi:hypothetical protein
VTIHLDGQAYVHADVGRCTFTGDTPEAFDTAISGCVTDCLKRCPRQLGRQFGNELYDKASRADLRKPGRKQVASESAAMTVEEAKTVPCPMGAKSHPEFKGLVLEQVAKLPDGIKVLEYLASNQYRPNGDKDGQKAKAAARLLLDAVKPGGIEPPERNTCTAPNAHRPRAKRVGVRCKCPAGTQPAGQPAR